MLIFRGVCHERDKSEIIFSIGSSVSLTAIKTSPSLSLLVLLSSNKAVAFGTCAHLLTHHGEGDMTEFSVIHFSGSAVDGQNPANQMILNISRMRDPKK